MLYDKREYGNIIQPAVIYLSVGLYPKLARNHRLLPLVLIFLTMMSLEGNSQVMKLNVANPSMLESVEGFQFAPCISAECDDRIDSLRVRLNHLGYLLADFVKRVSGDTIFVSIKEGPRYVYGTIETSQVPREVSVQFALAPNFVYSPQLLDSLYESILKYYENRGYPFASTGMDSINISGTRINGVIEVDKGMEVLFAGVRDQEENFRSSWLAKQASIIPGDPYSQAKVEGLEDALKRAGIRVISQSVDFSIPNRAGIIVQTEKLRNSTFDGILGLQQNALTGKTTLAGYLDLSLSNLFKTGKQLDLKWERLRPQTQELMLDYLHPALLRSTDLRLGFELFRMDSSFLNRNLRLDLQRRLGTEWSVVGSYRFQNSILLERSSSADLPDAAESAIHSGGLGILNSKGKNHIKLVLLLGSKFIRGSSVEPPTPSSMVENILQWSAEFETMRFARVSKLWEFRIYGLAGIISSEKLFQNDLSLLGGLRSIRGFNERSFFSDRYMLFQFEPRLTLGDDSNLLIFWDSGFISTPPQTGTSWVNGWGAGLELEVDNSRFRLIAGWGKEENQPVDYSNPRIHIGFVSNF